MWCVELSPAVTVLQAIRDHIKWQHESILSRGTKHTDPDKELDVVSFLMTTVKGKWFKHTPGREISLPKDRALDVMTAGVTELTVKGQFECWFDHRDYARSTCQIWVGDLAASSDEAGGSGASNSSADGEGTIASDASIQRLLIELFHVD